MASALDLMHGTVDLLVLRTLAWEPMHGYGISQFVRDRTAGKIAIATSRLSPAAAEKMTARSHRKQLEAPPAPPSDGTLLEPGPIGTGVRGGWKKKAARRRSGHSEV